MSTTKQAPAEHVFFCGKRQAWVARALANDGTGDVWEFWGGVRAIIAQRLEVTGKRSQERYWPRWEARARTHDMSPWHPDVKAAILEVLGGFPSLRPVAERAIDRAMSRETKILEENEALRARLHARP